MAEKCNKLNVMVSDRDGGNRRQVAITGKRNCDTALALIRHKGGISSLDRWAFGWRLSHYVFCLRKLGLNIETQEEQDGDIRYGRYILHSRVEILERSGGDGDTPAPMAEWPQPVQPAPGGDLFGGAA